MLLGLDATIENNELHIKAYRRLHNPITGKREDYEEEQIYDEVLTDRIREAFRAEFESELIADGRITFQSDTDS